MSLSCLIGTPPRFAKQIVLQIIFKMMSWQYLYSSRQTNSFRGRNPNPKFWCNEVINRLSGPSHKLNALTFQRKSLLYLKDFRSTKAIQYIITFTNQWFDKTSKIHLVFDLFYLIPVRHAQSILPNLTNHYSYFH